MSKKRKKSDDYETNPFPWNEVKTVEHRGVEIRILRRMDFSFPENCEYRFSAYGFSAYGFSGLGESEDRIISQDGAEMLGRARVDLRLAYIERRRELEAEEAAEKKQRADTI